MPYAETPSGRIYCESHGEGPPLLIAPSFGATTRTYRGMLPNLTETHRVLLYDPAGMGQSDDLSGDLTLASMADDVAAVLHHFGVDRASVLGLSMGAMIAQKFAALHRDRLDRLVLITPPAKKTQHGDAVNELLGDLFDACEPNRFMRHMLHLALSPDFVNRHPRVVEQIAQGIEVTPRDAATMARMVQSVSRFNGVAGLAEMDAPTLIIAGALDIFTPPSHAKALQAELPCSQLIVMDGVAHTPFIERAKETFAAVKLFLNSGSPAGSTDSAPGR